MNGLRRFSLREAVRARNLLGKSNSFAKNLTIAKRALSVYSEKEHAEEIVYLRKMEAARQAQMKAELDRILALEDTHEDKEKLSKLLEKKAEPTGFISKYGLDDWKYALPLGIILAVPTLTNEVLILDSETQIVACFMIFVATVYKQGGSMIAKALDDYSEEILNKMKEADNRMMSQMQSAIAANQEALSLEEDFKEIYTLTDQMSMAHADVLNHMEAHKYRAAVAKKLDSLIALEEAATVAIRTRMLDAVKAEVISSFKDDKKTKDAALNQAISVLSAGKSAKMGKDIVGDAFKSALSNYKEQYSKMDPASDPILMQLEKDMNAVATPPTPEGAGGNVCVTNPLL